MKNILAFFFLLFLCSLSVYLGSFGFEFTMLDDKVQVVNNLAIRSINWSNIKTIFSSTSVGMYQPLTTFIYAIAYQLKGLDASTFKAFSFFFHCFNCILLFQIFKKFKLKQIVAMILVGIFALHPLQVESVSWVSAFSNLVFTSFYLISLLFYLKYEATKNQANYFFSFLFFLFSCFSKSMAVSLPVLLLFYLISKLSDKKINWIQLIPFFVISVVFGLITIFSRESVGHLSDLSVQFNWLDRIFLISYSVLFYPFKFLIPFDLSAFYPYPRLDNGFLPLSYYISLPILLFLFYISWAYRKHFLLFFGAGFYLISIALVTQIIPVGNQLTTDRYIYLPMIGLLFILGHFLQQIKRPPLVIFLLIPFLLAFKSYQRTKIWENDQLIWEDVIQKYPNVAQAHNNLGSFLQLQGQNKRALTEYNLAIKLKPYYADAFSNRGSLLAQKGDIKKALLDYDKAIELKPHADAYFNRANTFAELGKFNLAIQDYTKSIAIQKSSDAFTNRAFIYLKTKSIDQAIADLRNALKIKPQDDRAHFLMGMSYKVQQKKSLACKAFKRAIQLGNKNAKRAYSDYCTKP